MTQPAIVLLGGLVATWNHRFLQAAYERGLRVLLVDGPQARLHQVRATGGEPNAHPWSRIAELGENDPHAPGQVLDTCLAWAQRYDIRGVCCLREEYVTAAALVADVLGLPSPGRRAARVCRNKYLQRRYLSRWSPYSELITPARRAGVVATWSRFPAVIKPVGRLASSGVCLVQNVDELRASLPAYSAVEVLLLEERVEGQEYSVESLSRHGLSRYAEVTEKRTTEDDGEPYFVELGHTTPAPLPDQIRIRLLATHDEILRRLDFDTGIAHGEYRIGPDARISLTEIAVRPPGDAIMNLHGLATGGSLEDAVVGLALGEDPDVPAAPTRWARQVFLPHTPGTLARLEITRPLGTELHWFDRSTACDLLPVTSRADDPPTVRCLIALKPAGARLEALHESADRAATFVIDAPTRSELDQLEMTVRAAVRLEVAS